MYFLYASLLKISSAIIPREWIAQMINLNYAE